MTGPVRRRLLSIDDPLELGGRPESPPEAPTEPAPVELPREVERRALFVRLPLAEADAVARAAFELGVHKQDLVAALVRRYVDAHSPEGLSALREMLRQVS